MSGSVETTIKNYIIYLTTTHFIVPCRQDKTQRVPSTRNLMPAGKIYRIIYVAYSVSERYYAVIALIIVMTAAISLVLREQSSFRVHSDQKEIGEPIDK